MTNQKIRESLNKLDRIALDECTQYYDLLNLYEAMKPLSNDEQKAISDAVKTKNPDTINATMSKVMMDRDPSLKNRANKLTMSATTMESLDEDMPGYGELSWEEGEQLERYMDLFDEEVDREYDSGRGADRALNFFNDFFGTDIQHIDEMDSYLAELEGTKKLLRFVKNFAYNFHLGYDESLELEEGRNDLEAVECQAIESHKKYWAPYDKKEKKFAEYGSRFRYDSKEACEDAIADPEKTLGYEDDEQHDRHKIDRVKSSKNPMREEAINEGPSYSEPEKVELWHKGVRKVNVKACSDDKLERYYEIADRFGYDDICDIIEATAKERGLKLPSIRSNSNNTQSTSQAQPVQQTQVSQPAQAPQPAQPQAVNPEPAQSSVSSTVDTSNLRKAVIPEELNEEDENQELEVEGKLTLGNKTIDLSKFHPEDWDFITTPITKSGKVKAETLGILSLYNHVYNLGETKIPREVILKDAGVDLSKRQGEHSVWFTAWDALDLGHLNGDGTVSPGGNLKGWVEGTIQPKGVIHHRGNPFSKDPSKFPTDPWDETIGPGNPDGLDLRRYIPQSQVAIRPTQGIVSDRSHGKGDTTTGYSTAKPITNSNKVQSEPQSSISTTVDTSNLRKAVIPEDLDETVDSEIKINPNEEKRIQLMNNRRDRMRADWKKFHNLDEDAQIDYKKSYNDDSFKHFCAMHGYSYTTDKDLFLGD